MCSFPYSKIVFMSLGVNVKAVHNLLSHEPVPFGSYFDVISTGRATTLCADILAQLHVMLNRSNVAQVQW